MWRWLRTGGRGGWTNDFPRLIAWPRNSVTSQVKIWPRRNTTFNYCECPSAVTRVSYLYTYLCIYAIRYLPASNGRRRRHIRQKPVAPALQVTLWHNNIHNIIIIFRRTINTFCRVKRIIISWFVARIKKLDSHRVCKRCVINYDDLSTKKK